MTAILALILGTAIASTTNQNVVCAQHRIPDSQSRGRIRVLFAGRAIDGPSSTLRGYRVVAPLIQDDALLPLGDVIASLGGRVSTMPNGKIRIMGAQALRKLDLAVGSRVATADGSTVCLDVAPERSGRTTFVPLRRVAETLGASVVWLRSGLVEVYRSDDPLSPKVSASPSPGPTPCPTPTCCCSRQQSGDPRPVWWRALLLAFLLIAETLAVCSIARRTWPPQRSLGVLAQVVLAWLAVVGATLHAFPIVQKDGDPYPVADAITQAWLLFFVVAFFLPRISSLKLFGSELEVKKDYAEYDQARVAQVDALEQAQVRSGEFLVGASDSLVKLSSAMRDTTEISGLGRLVATYAERRMAELSRWLNLPDEKTRLSIWLYNDTKHGLQFFVSNEKFGERAVQHVFSRGDGLISWCFEENKVLSVADAEKTPGFVSFPEEQTFHGLLLIPIRIGDKAVGVLSIDRDKIEAFDPATARISQIVANNIGVALTEASMRQKTLASGGPP